MNKVKSLLLLVCIAGFFVACKKNKPVDVEAQFTADTLAISKYIKANNIPAIKHESGIFYQIIAAGSGSVKYTTATQVTADYQGKIMGGNVFDDSKGTPITFTLGEVIQGWNIGIPLIQKGGQIRLFIPSYYGYGTRDMGAIAPNSILDFNIKLTDVK